MNSQQDVIYGLMNELEEALDHGIPLLGAVSIVKKDIVTNILDKLYAALPDEIKEARALLRRKDELQYEAQQRAEKVISDAQAEANRLLSEAPCFFGGRLIIPSNILIYNNLMQSTRMINIAF